MMNLMGFFFAFTQQHNQTGKIHLEREVWDMNGKKFFWMFEDIKKSDVKYVIGKTRFDLKWLKHFLNCSLHKSYLHNIT